MNFDYEKVLADSGCKFDSLDGLLWYVRCVLERMRTGGDDEDLQQKIDILNGIFGALYVE